MVLGARAVCGSGYLERMVGVHIRCCGNGGLGFRPYGESLLSNARNAGPAKSNQKVSPRAYGPRCARVPSFRRPSGGIATSDVLDCVEGRYAPFP